MADTLHEGEAAGGHSSDERSTEDYNQIDPSALDCFPVGKYPVDLYKFRETDGVLAHIYSAGDEVSNAMHDEFRQLSENGMLFFSRKHIEAYSATVACDLSTALSDPNLTWDEKSGIFIESLKLKQNDVFAHPMPNELDELRNVLGLLCQHLVEDSSRTARLVRDIHADLTPDNRRVNASLMGLAVYMEIHKGSIMSEVLEMVGLGFFLYDIGMTKVSHLMIGKKQKLTPREQRTVQAHPLKSIEMISKMGIERAEVLEPALQHHERINGSGYPKGLSNDRIGQLGRIVGVTDTYSAMITDTPQRKGFTPVEAISELIKKDDLYDPIICRTLVRLLQATPAS